MYPGYQEIDIVEDSYWSGYTDMVGKYTLYPQGEDSGKHLNDRVWTQSGKGATVRMTWTPGKVLWETWESHLTEDLARTTPIAQGGYYSGALTEGIPVPRSQRMHINLWAFRGKGGWESIPATTMHLKDFKFTPWAGSFGVQVGQAGAGRSAWFGAARGCRYRRREDSSRHPAAGRRYFPYRVYRRRLRCLGRAARWFDPHEERPGQR